MDWLTPLYPWTKAFHLVAVIAWMAGMLYLPRLFVYHGDAAPGTPASEMLKVMERRLLRAIINPAMIATVLLGVALLATPGVADWSHGWLHARPARFYRIVNEVPTILMIAIVILVVVKPF